MASPVCIEASLMGYASTSDVAALCNNILNGSSDFSASSVPTACQVQAWISSGCGILESTLAGLGYGVPVASTIGVFDILRELNALYGAARTELSRTNITIGPGERTRGQIFNQMFWDELGKMKALDLGMYGLSRSSTGKLYVGGISNAEKQSIEGDTDRVQPRFKRGQFAFPDTLRPDTLTTAS